LCTRQHHLQYQQQQQQQQRQLRAQIEDKSVPSSSAKSATTSDGASIEPPAPLLRASSGANHFGFCFFFFHLGFVGDCFACIHVSYLTRRSVEIRTQRRAGKLLAAMLGSLTSDSSPLSRAAMTRALGRLVHTIRYRYPIAPPSRTPESF
jgi:hypothetical protein